MVCVVDKLPAVGMIAPSAVLTVALFGDMPLRHSSSASCLGPECQVAPVVEHVLLLLGNVNPLPNIVFCVDCRFLRYTTVCV